MNSVLLSARNRATGEARAVECDANGTLYSNAVVVPGPTTIADGADVAQGATTDAEAAGNGSVIAILKRLRALLSALPLSLGQKLMAASLPVVIASDQSNVPVSQATHNNLNCNANLQVGDSDANTENPVPTYAPGPFTAVLSTDHSAITDDVMYQLVDLSDNVNYPHSGTGSIILKRIRLHAEKASDAEFEISVGVVIENDGTDGSAKWVHRFHLVANGNPTDSTDRFAQEIELNLDLLVSVGAPFYFVSNLGLANSELLQNDVARTSPVGTGNPGVGDLVVYCEETGGTGGLTFTIAADYDTYGLV